ncbi:MAG: bromoperoxidase [Pseudomonadota bacterium]
MTDYRREAAKEVRDSATSLANEREHPVHRNNGDEQRYASGQYAMCFTKGLDHNIDTGLVTDKTDFEAFRTAIDEGFVRPFTEAVPVPTTSKVTRRVWEAPTAGVVFELQGPDPQAVTMPPAPALGSEELTFEMAEVYELALLRDEPFTSFAADAGSTAVMESVKRLNGMSYATEGFIGRTRTTGPGGTLDEQTIFRGASPGVEFGPYLSQLMHIGNKSVSNAEGLTPADGYIRFGAQRVDQRVIEAKEDDDYMMTWDTWHAVQQGYRPNGPSQEYTNNRRFITTPRDLATYVRIDALYQAYLNACLILLGSETPFDPGFDLLSGAGRKLAGGALGAKELSLNAGGFALWGGPHILSLVTEVSTRALKAVRYQKFNNHLRLRPEALAARIEKAHELEARFGVFDGKLGSMKSDLTETLDHIEAHNNRLAGKKSVLLPMAFAEGSPMHPAYGAGHATVAGACVTILKAFFDTSAIFVRIDGNAGFHTSEQILAQLIDCKTVEAGAYTASDTGEQLDFTVFGEFESIVTGNSRYVRYVPEIVNEGESSPIAPLTLEGELNKLAANISIGRNMAGVHYFSDYYDSVRMGEEIAIGILEEQALCYRTDPFVFSVPTFDGEVRRIGLR